MTVFVLVWNEDMKGKCFLLKPVWFQGREVKGVFSTEAKAKAEEARLRARGVPTVYPGDWFTISECELDELDDDYDY